ncbi:MAG: hypothetical protein IIA03_16605 [Proteobacteria bacterium]|nr:hypothetical protein [Pseudomonadota bacterium]
MLHAFTHSPRDMCQIGTWLHANDPARPDLLVPSLALTTFSQVPIERIAADVVARVNQVWKTRAQQPDGGYTRVRFIGHSMGSLIARRVYLDGLAAGKDAPWAARTDRLLLFAGVNRGWTIDHHMSLVNSTVYQLGVTLNDIVVGLGGAPFTVMASRHGAPFVNQLRLDWQALPQRWADRQAPGSRSCNCWARSTTSCRPATTSTPPRPPASCTCRCPTAAMPMSCACWPTRRCRPCRPACRSPTHRPPAPRSCGWPGAKPSRSATASRWRCAGRGPTPVCSMWCSSCMASATRGIGRSAWRARWKTRCSPRSRRTHPTARAGRSRASRSRSRPTATSRCCLSCAPGPGPRRPRG